MENMFWMLYPVLGLLGAEGGRWGAEMEGPNVRKLPNWGSVCPLRSHIWGDFWQTQWTECMENMFLMLYPVLRSLGANGGWWGAEMQEKFRPMWGNRLRGQIFAHPGVNSQWISDKQSTQNPWRTCC